MTSQLGLDDQLLVVSFCVFGPVEPAGSKTAWRSRDGHRAGVRDANPQVRLNRADLARCGAEAMTLARRPGLVDGPLRLDIVIYRRRPKGHYGTGKNAARIRPGAPPFPTTKPDVNKQGRQVEDALTGVVWRDDAQIVEEHLQKRYGVERVEITVSHAAAEGDP